MQLKEHNYFWEIPLWQKDTMLIPSVYFAP